MMEIKTVTVIGANGVMGSNVSGIFAAFGDAKVYMVSRDIAKSKIAATQAIKSVRADSISRNLVPADYAMLDNCIGESDLVFESVAENLAIKLAVTKQIAKALKREAVLCSGTSGLSVTALSESIPEHQRARYLGLHFYNPPYNMPLCEVIPTVYTSRPLLEKIKAYLSDVLYRTVVASKDTPAFIGNRIGFHFINKAMQFAEKHKQSGGIDYIDAILGAFSGRNMPPLVTSDFVGLDVHKAIVDNLYANTSDYAHDVFVVPAFAENLIGKGFLGRKVNSGLYRTEAYNGKKRYRVYDIASGEYRDKINYNFHFAAQMMYAFQNGNYKNAFEILLHNRSTEAEICLEFLLEYIIYALFVAQSIGGCITSADDVMAAGFNWCPPLALIDAFTPIANFQTLLNERLSRSILHKMDIENLLKHIPPSIYDYRPYFKSKK